jgi:hypothetical protein
MKFNLSISRNSRDLVGIRVKCDKSRVTFLELELTLEQYAQVITGLSEVEVEGATRGLAYVGKTKFREHRSVELPDGLYNYRKEPVVEYLKEHHQEEGWIQDLYLGSQGSITLDQNTKKYTANYAVYRYEESKE